MYDFQEKIVDMCYLVNISFFSHYKMAGKKNLKQYGQCYGVDLFIT